MTVSVSQSVVVGVGIDTARYGHEASFLDENREMVAPNLSFDESRNGYCRLVQQLEKLGRKFPGVRFHIRIDAAGQYAANLERFLRECDLPITLSIGEPRRNRDYHRAMSPKHKSDVSESRAMARYAIAERPDATPATPKEFNILREIASRLEGQVKSTSQAINRLHNLLSRTFPELATIAPNLAAEWVIRLLDKYPTPERITRAKQESLSKIPYINERKAKTVRDAAKATVASLQGPLAEQLVRQAVAEVKHAQMTQKSLEKLLCEAFRSLPESGHVQVVTIPGIGVTTAAILVAKIVSIERFATPENLVGYFGVFPEEYSSGVDRNGTPQRRRAHMCRKGNDLVRRYLFCAAKSAITHNPAVRALYARLRARGTRGDVAMGHCMRKLLHLVFAVWTTNKPFDKDHYQWETSENSAGERSNTEGSDVGQQKTAGPKRELIPCSKEVTAAPPNVCQTMHTVNPAEQTTGGCESIDYAHLRSQVTMQQVLKRTGHWDCLRGSEQRNGPCPFHTSHNAKTKSFSVSITENVFRCCHPTCGVQGNVLDYWVAHTGLPLYQSAVDLANTFGLQKTTNRREEVTRNTESPENA